MIGIISGNYLTLRTSCCRNCEIRLVSGKRTARITREVDMHDGSQFVFVCRNCATEFVNNVIEESRKALQEVEQ